MATLDGRAGRAGAAPTGVGRLFSTLLSQLASAVVDTEAAAATAIIMAIICFFIDPS